MKRALLFALLVVAVFAAMPAPSASSATLSISPASQIGTGYWCPPYSRYCSKNSQCAGYCGTGTPPEWEVCEFGCCACLG